MMKKRRASTPAKGTSSNPYKRVTRIPREIESAAGLWLDFFQQFADMVLDQDRLHGVPPEVFAQYSQAAIDRARILADCALTAFQERFPGVHP